MDMNEELVRQIVKKVLAEMGQETTSCCAEFEKRIAPSGVVGVKTSTVKCEPFGQEGVTLKDIFTLGESPRIGCGLMELDHTSFEWTLTYDECLSIIDGYLEIETNGTIISGGAGDIIHIPKGSHVHYQTPTHARYAYFVYPADWANQT